MSKNESLIQYGTSFQSKIIASLLVAKKMGLDYFGCDLDKDYVEFMKSRMSKEEVWDKFGG